MMVLDHRVSAGQAGTVAVFARGLTRRFGSRLAVDRLDLAVAQGEILALLGPNGAGKTTTVRMLTGLLRPDAGSGVVAGFNVIEQPHEVRRHVGLMTDVPGVYAEMRLRAYLRWFGELYGLSPGHAASRTDEVIDQFGLADWTHSALVALSRGTQQKVALARCLLHEPDVLLLDEPTASLDVEATIGLRALLAGLKGAGRAIILCTHNLTEAERVADTVAILIAGRCVHTQSLHVARGARTISVQLVAPDRVDLESVTAAPGVEAESIRMEGTTLTFVSRDPEQSTPAVVAVLVHHGCGVVQVTDQGQSLESIYLHHLREAADAGG